MARAKADSEQATSEKALFEAAYHRYVAKWSLTVSHELVHGWLCYLGGHREAMTPKDMKPPGYVNSLRGEAGRVWEIRALGGSSNYWVLTHEPEFFLRRVLGKPSYIRTGSVWLEFTRNGCQRMAKVTPEAIKDLAHGSTSPLTPGP